MAKDRPLNAKATAKYWIEYVIKYQGASHLQYPGAKMNILQKNSIDIIALSIAVIYIFIALLKFFVRKVCKCFATKKPKKKTN